MNGKLANFFRILGANMAGIATVLGFILAGYGAFLIDHARCLNRWLENAQLYHPKSQHLFARDETAPMFCNGRGFGYADYVTG